MDGWAGSVPGTPHLDQVWLLATVSWLEQVVGKWQESPGHEGGECPRVGDQVVVHILASSWPVSAAFWWHQSLPGSALEPRHSPMRQPSLLPHHSFAGRSLPTRSLVAP